MVARRVAHIVEIVVLAARPYAFLRRCRPNVIALFHPRETVLELNHPRVGKHQGRIITRHQRAAVHDPVAIAVEIIKKGRADIVQRWHIAAPYQENGSFAFRLAGRSKTVHNAVTCHAKGRRFDAQAFVRFRCRISRPARHRCWPHRLPYGNPNHAKSGSCPQSLAPHWGWI